MPLSILEVRRQIVLVLYDYLLSSDGEGYWYDLDAVQEALDGSTSGALAKISIDALVADKFVQVGQDGDYKAIYALTPKGVETAEKLLAKAGISLDQYAPAPSADLILSQINDHALTQAITSAVIEVQKQFVQSNEAGELNDTDRAIIAGELKSGADISAAPFYRLRTLKSVLVPALRFVIEKFAGSALEEAAKTLLKLLLG